jgi:hypothetical protein
MSAAGIGAGFAALFRVNRYVANGTYDPKYESSYWVRFVLGITAGIVLSSLVPITQDQSGFTRPLLCLLGGFSASVVYRIMSRLVDTLESLVQGDPRELGLARNQVTRAEMAMRQANEQLRFGAALLRVREEVEKEALPADTKAAIRGIIEELGPFDMQTATSGNSSNGDPQPT